MACDPNSTITNEQLANLNTNTKVFNEVVTSTDLVTPTPASDGEQKLTLKGLESKADEVLDAYRARYIGDYVLPNKTFEAKGDFVAWAISDGGDGNDYIYIGPESDLPYTTDVSTYPDPNNDPNLQLNPSATAAYVEQRIDERVPEIVSDLTDLVFSDVSDMQSNSSALELGNKIRISSRQGDQGSTFEIVTGETPNGYDVIDTTQADLQAKYVPNGVMCDFDALIDDPLVDITTAFNYAIGVYSDLNFHADTYVLNGTVNPQSGGKTLWCNSSKFVRNVDFDGGMLIVDDGASDYTSPLGSFKIVGGQFIDISNSTTSGVGFVLVEDLQIIGTKFIGLARCGITSRTDVEGSSESGLGISSCITGSIRGVRLSGFRNDGLIISAGQTVGALQDKAVNAIKVSDFHAEEMSISAYGTNRGANGCVITNFTIKNCGDGYAWLSINSADNIASNGVIIGDENVTYSASTYGLRLGHGYQSGIGNSIAPRCKASNIIIKNTGSGVDLSVTDGGTVENISVFNVEQDAYFIMQQRNLQFINNNSDGSGRDGIRISNSENVTIKGGKILNTQQNGLTVIEATQSDSQSPLGITNLDIDGVLFKDYSRAGISNSRGAVFISQSLEVGENIEVRRCEFKASQPYNCIVQRHTKQIVNIYSNTVSGSIGSFILAANNARQQATSVWGNQRRMSNGNSLEIYPETIEETGRGNGATTSMTSTKYGNWSELLASNADYDTVTSLLIDSGTTAPTFPLNFTSLLSSGVVTYNFSGGGTLSFKQKIIKTLAVTS